MNRRSFMKSVGAVAATGTYALADLPVNRDSDAIPLQKLECPDCGGDAKVDVMDFAPMRDKKHDGMRVRLQLTCTSCKRRHNRRLGWVTDGRVTYQGKPVLPLRSNYRVSEIFDDGTTTIAGDDITLTWEQNLAGIVKGDSVRFSGRIVDAGVNGMKPLDAAEKVIERLNWRRNECM